MQQNKSKTEYQALQFSLYTIVALMICSLIFNELTESNIIEVDAGSYVISGIIGLITIYISKLQTRPKDENHPLGFSGYVPVLNLIRSFMVILICIKAIGESIGSIVSGPEPTDHTIMFSYAAVTLFFNVCAYIYVNRQGKKIDSALLKTDALDWKTDIVFNFSIILAVCVSYGLQFTTYKTYADYVDPVFCIIFSIAMAYYPIVLFSENIKILAVTSIDKETQTQIIQSFHDRIDVIQKYSPAFTVIHVGGVLWVNIELNVRQEDEPIALDYLAIKNTGESILNEITPDNKISFLFNRIEK
ncbi:cation transporter [Cytophaga aurantiaca]|uniref:cation transporter n=1 Tax=Cytophaga aurantiaca TaxID=29530 RepID=UPI0003603475|nr:cation transporter [Cytophaga aurantiaca]